MIAARITSLYLLEQEANGGAWSSATGRGLARG